MWALNAAFAVELGKPGVCLASTDARSSRNAARVSASD